MSATKVWPRMTSGHDQKNDGPDTANPTAIRVNVPVDTLM